MSIATLVKELREKTSAGILDCQKALAATDNKVVEAITWLREKGLAKAISKAGRIATEGLVAVAMAPDYQTAVAIEVNAETDFVARNSQFQQLVKEIAALALKCNSLEELNEALLGGVKVRDAILENVAIIGEQINLRRMAKITAQEGALNYYVHNQIAPSLGTIAAIVAVKAKADLQQVSELAKNLSIHVAANEVKYLSVEKIPEAIIADELAIITKQAQALSDNEKMVANITANKLTQFQDSIALLSQPYVFDHKLTIAQVLADKSREWQTPVEISAFARLVVGEGIEAEKSDFAAEVGKISQQQ